MAEEKERKIRELLALAECELCCYSDVGCEQMSAVNRLEDIDFDHLADIIFDAARDLRDAIETGENKKILLKRALERIEDVVDELREIEREELPDYKQWDLNDIEIALHNAARFLKLALKLLDSE